MTTNSTKVHETVPAELKARPQWVCWKNVERNGRPTKVPFKPDGAEASSTDAATWSCFEECWAAYVVGGFDGIGFVFVEGDGLVGIDLDNCRDPDGRLVQWAQGWVDRFATYTEVSPSGTGVKLFLHGTNPFGRGRKKNLPDAGVGGADACVEMYSSSRYFTVTGHVLEGHAKIVEADDALKAFAQHFWPDMAPAQPSGEALNLYQPLIRRAWAYVQKMDNAISGLGGHNATFAAACKCAEFGLNKAAAMVVMRRFNDEKTGGERWSDAELLHKVEDAEKTVRAAGDLASKLPPRERGLPTETITLGKKPERAFGPGYAQLAAQFAAALQPEGRAWFAEHLRVQAHVLEAFGVGWCVDAGAFTLPMTTADGFTTGISLRWPDGLKRHVDGSKAGLYIPAGWEHGWPVVICEGFSDTASAFDWGFPAMGRPSCSAGTEEIRIFVRTYAPTDIIIAADNDEAGRTGARRLADRLVADGIGVVRIVLPPNGFKDLRAWKAAGATADQFMQAIAASPVHEVVTEH